MMSLDTLMIILTRKALPMMIRTRVIPLIHMLVRHSVGAVYVAFMMAIKLMSRLDSQRRRRRRPVRIESYTLAGERMWNRQTKGEKAWKLSRNEGIGHEELHYV